MPAPQQTYSLTVSSLQTGDEARVKLHGRNRWLSLRTETVSHGEVKLVVLLRSLPRDLGAKLVREKYNVKRQLERERDIQLKKCLPHDRFNRRKIKEEYAPKILEAKKETVLVVLGESIEVGEKLICERRSTLTLLDGATFELGTIEAVNTVTKGR